MKVQTAVDHSQANLEQFLKWIETNITVKEKEFEAATKAEAWKAAKDNKSDPDPKVEIPETAAETEEAAEDEALKE